MWRWGSTAFHRLLSPPAHVHHTRTINPTPRLWHSSNGSDATVVSIKCDGNGVGLFSSVTRWYLMRSGRKKHTMRSTQSSSVASETARLTPVNVNTGTSINCSGEHLHTCRTIVKVNTGTSSNSVIASASTRVQQVSNNNRKHRYV